MTATTNLRAALEAALPAARQDRLRQVQSAAAAEHAAAYLVGGPVRDLLLGLPPGDLDIVVVGGGALMAAPRLARRLARAVGGSVTVHRAFGTATWTPPSGDPIDLATARTETYARPAALPTVTPAESITDDLARRDFAINAMAVRLDGEHYGELLDPHGGQADLDARLVRVLHPGSFTDDPTRIFRAVRYAERLGFRMADDTLAQVPQGLRHVPKLSGERVRHELEMIAREANAPAMLARLAELGALRAVHPALTWGPSQAERAAAILALPWRAWGLAAAPELFPAYLALLLDGAAGQALGTALSRLSLTREAHEAVTGALLLPPLGHKPSEVVAQLDQLNEAGVVAAYVLRPDERERIGQYLAHWRHVRAEITGDDLLALGLPPGPLYKQLLWQARAARLDGEVADGAGEMRLVRAWAGLE